ncbi:Helix-turn-helix, AraC domain protein [[Leptolyngbya] sp. PCC 7376]|nr:Helix-turn-helix, AraC domain protein [[Leptolyngbya] sp. PCC 7376]
MNTSQRKFLLDQGWQVFLNDLKIIPQDLLRQANLPLDLFSQAKPMLSTPEYFRLWDSLASLLSDDPAFPLRVAQSISVEFFSPAMFACICSDNLAIALQRLAQYKPLVGPWRLVVETNDRHTAVSFGEFPGQLPLPPSLIAMELAFFVHLARMATRDRLIPLQVHTTVDIPALEQYEAFFGIPVTKGQTDGVIFSAIDVAKPFLTSNAGMWSIFEPVLNQRLHELQQHDLFSDRVRACLAEILASGQCSMADVAKRLAVSPRTLQRRLKAENSSFKQELSDLRAELANHYLVTTTYSSSEISFLLGYSDPSSFFRAFNIWTGKTPDLVREMSRA